MTQPRKEQIKSVNTRFSPLEFPAAPEAAQVTLDPEDVLLATVKERGAGETAIGAGFSTVNVDPGLAVQPLVGDRFMFTSGLNAGVIRQVSLVVTPTEFRVSPALPSTEATSWPFLLSSRAVGAQEDVQAFVRGTVLGPFPILAGDGIVFSIDGAPDQTVTFAATDTTCSRVADKINATLGVDVASNDRGFLVLQSPTRGASSSLELTNDTPGTLAKLGLTEGTFTGIAGPSAGVLTRTPDNLGGTSPLSTTDGRTLVTDNQGMVLKELSGTVTQSYWDVPGGVPLVGKLIWDGADFVLRFMASLPPKAALVTFGSAFSLLDGGDSLDLTVDGVGSFAVSFPAFPYDRDGVVDRINDVYATNAGFADGRARVLTTVSSPFDIAAGEQFFVSVDGGAPVAVAFAGGEITVADVASVITGAAAGTSVTTVTTGGATLMLIQSTNTAGASSSLEFWSDASSPGTLGKLGIRAGLYRGVFVAEPWGPDEIRLRSFLRGSSAAVTVGGSATTLSRMGLAAGTVNGSDVPVPEPALFPHDTLDQASVAAYRVRSLLPDVREFGETRAEEETWDQEFQSRSSGSDIDYLNTAHLQDTAAVEFGSNTSPGRGMFSAGKPGSVAPDGTLPAAVRAASEVAGRFFKQIMNTAGGVVSRLVANEITTGGYQGNPLPVSTDMAIRVDPGDAFPGAERSMTVYGGPNAVATFSYNASALFPALIRTLKLIDGAVLSGEDAGMQLSDTNVRSLGGVGAINLTTSTDPSLRIADSEVAGTAIESAYSIMRSLNARTTVVCGDGVSTFGDFNGDEALRDALDFANASGLTELHIVVKAGNYLIDGASNELDFSAFTYVMIEGAMGPWGNTELADGLPVYIENDRVDGITGPTAGTLVLKNLSIEDPTPSTNRKLFQDRGTVIMENCEWVGCRIGTRMLSHFRATDCEFHGTGLPDSTPVVQFFQDTTTSPGNWTNRGILFERCYMSSAPHNAIVDIAMTTASQSSMRFVRFEDCQFLPGRSTSTGFALALTNSVGLLNFQPGAGLALNSAFSGLQVREVVIRNCRFQAGGQGSGTARSFLYLSQTGFNGDGSSFDFATSNSVRISRLVMENVTCDTSGAATDAIVPWIYAGGIGINSTLTWDDEEPVPGIEIKNLKLDLPSGNTLTSGGAPISALPFMTNPFSPWALTGDIWPASIMLSGETMRITDLQVTGAKALNDWPDILLFPYRHMKVDGLYMDDWSTGGSGSAPDGRVVIRQIMFPSTFGGTALKDRTTWVIEGLVLDGGNQTADWVSVTGTVLMIEPTGPRIPTAGNLHTNPGNSFQLRNFAVRGFITPTPFNLPVMIGSYGQSDGYGPNYTTDIGSRYGHDGLLLENGNIGQPDYNVAAAQGRAGSYGVWFHASANEVGVAVKCRNLAVTGCYFYGIRIDQKDFETLTAIEDCYVRDCGLDVDSLGAFGTGIVATGDNWRGYTTIIGNLSHNNNDTPSDIQITCRKSGSSSVGTRATKCSIYGNSCFYQTKAPSVIVASVGEINATQNDITLLSSISPSIYLGVYVRGLETAYASSGGTASNINQARYDVGGALVHNLAFLRSSFSDA